MFVQSGSFRDLMVSYSSRPVFRSRSVPTKTRPVNRSLRPPTGYFLSWERQPYRYQVAKASRYARTIVRFRLGILPAESEE